jgi:hypothetical protein
VLTATAATISLSLVLAIVLLPRPSTGWEEVTKAVQRQKWIRGTIATSDGKQNVTWLSPERQVWALQSNDWLRFCDGQQRTKYEYRAGDKQILKMPLGEEDSRRVFPVDDLSQGKTALAPWMFGTEKIVSQSRREVTEAGKTWIDFKLIFWRGNTNPATLRVDPGTRLPVYLLCGASGTATNPVKMIFDYPADGPTDIYALGVATDIRIDDRMPSEGCLNVLEAIAASRARIGDFRLLVAQYPGYPSNIVCRKGDRWRVDLCWPQDGCNPMDKPAVGQEWGDWFAQRLKLCRQIPLYVCDGKTVYENSQPVPPNEKPVTWQRARSTAPQNLLSGEGLHALPQAYVAIASLVYPDLSPKPGWGFEFDPQPADAAGCVLIKRSARTTQKEPTVGHEWYYIDPEKGHAVVRVELFNLPARASADLKTATQRQSLRMEDFQRSPDGFWYPRLLVDTLQDTTVAPLPVSPQSNRTAAPVIRKIQREIRYHFEFDAALPDSLFSVDASESPNK